MTFLESYDAAAARWPEGTDLDVATSWGDTHVLTAGPPEAPPVVLLHGDGATATAWAGVATLLRDSHRVLAPDQPGNPGRSSSRRPFRTTEDLVAWVDELLDVVRPGPVHLVGHSSGAHLGLGYAMTRAPRVLTLSLLDPTLCFAGLRPLYLARALPMLLRPTPARVRRFLDWEAGGRSIEAAWTKAFVGGATEFDGSPVVRSRRPRPEELRRLAAPTLVAVAGRSRAHDPRLVARRAVAALADVTVAEVATASHHTMPVEDAAEIAGLIAAHVARGPAAR